MSKQIRNSFQSKVCNLFSPNLKLCFCHRIICCSVATGLVLLAVTAHNKISMCMWHVPTSMHILGAAFLVTPFSTSAYPQAKALHRWYGTCPWNAEELQVILRTHGTCTVTKPTALVKLSIFYGKPVGWSWTAFSFSSPFVKIAVVSQSVNNMGFWCSC